MTQRETLDLTVFFYLSVETETKNYRALCRRFTTPSLKPLKDAISSVALDVKNDLDFAVKIAAIGLSSLAFGLGLTL